ncbi:hypothetical protein ACNPQK_24255, partial [Acinetobacter guillouiae]|uniref:hypothetical protein n=1 Tax=Acinetobacter guillouiae TaxID=106649 RepID=UPI003AF47EB7
NVAVGVYGAIMSVTPYDCLPPPSSINAKPKPIAETRPTPAFTALVENRLANENSGVEYS